MKTDPKKLAEAFELLSSFNIRMHISTCSGFMDLDAEDVLAIADDPEQWEAKQCGVTVEVLRLYNAWSGECNAITRRGRQCKAGAVNRCCDVNQFVPGETDRCRVHSELCAR